MHELALPLLIGLIAVALAFDFLNGLHDAANSIATVVGTRLIGPVAAVGFAAFFNFAAYFLALKWPALHNVADTIGKGLVDKDLITPAVVFGALVGAMFWNVVTWVKGIPSSSSHALVGGIVGAGVAHAGFPSIQWIGLNKTLIAIVLSPVLGLILTMAIMLLTSWLFLRASARGASCRNSNRRIAAICATAPRQSKIFRRSARTRSYSRCRTARRLRALRPSTSPMSIP